jgi:hypothetical protein
MLVKMKVCKQKKEEEEEEEEEKIIKALWFLKYYIYMTA